MQKQQTTMDSGSQPPAKKQRMSDDAFTLLRVPPPLHLPETVAKPDILEVWFRKSLES